MSQENLKQIFEDAGHEVSDFSSGSTATCFLNAASSKIIAHVGDTRAIGFRKGFWRPQAGGLTSEGNVILEYSSDSGVATVMKPSSRVSYERQPQPPVEIVSLVESFQLTSDHKATLETNRIESLGGTVEGTRVAGLAVSRSFGAKHAQPFVKPEPDIILVHENIPVIICSDGIFDVLENQMAAETVATHGLQAIIQLALDKGARDNLACVFIAE